MMVMTELEAAAMCRQDSPWLEFGESSDGMVLARSETFQLAVLTSLQGTTEIVSETLNTKFPAFGFSVAFRKNTAHFSSETVKIRYFKGLTICSYCKVKFTTNRFTLRFVYFISCN
jgi:hypothetical protein